MKVRWEHLTPPEFEAMARKEKLCILPIGSLERHGEHLPFGTDALVAHHIACLAAEQESCVVFPPYWFGQVHEAACFSGTINFPAPLLLQLLETLLDQIAQNGFRKILIVNAHGGNNGFLDYFMMAQNDREVPYTLYKTFVLDGEWLHELDDMWDAPGGGHADELETSLMLAIAPEAVRMDQQRFAEPILPGHKLEKIKGVQTGTWWYDMYPEHVSGTPSAATAGKGQQVIEAAVRDLARRIKAVKEDEVAPALQQEFYRRKRSVGK